MSGTGRAQCTDVTRLRLVRRIAAHGIAVVDDRTLLTAVPGDPRERWALPGGDVQHGEHPADAVVRAIAAQTGMRAAVTGVRDVVTDLEQADDTVRHTDRVLYEVSVDVERLRTPHLRWVDRSEAAGLPLVPFTATLLGMPSVAPTGIGPDVLPAHSPYTGDRGQRFAAYALVVDRHARVLLTLIADGFPKAGHWHLPGGGTDPGEQPVEGLLREVYEETGQSGRLLGLFAVRHDHNPRAVGPEGRPIDWHSVQALYRMEVAEPTAVRVLETDGSTAGVRWFTLEEAARLPLTGVATYALDIGLPAFGRRDEPCA